MVPDIFFLLKLFISCAAQRERIMNIPRWVMDGMYALTGVPVQDDHSRRLLTIAPSICDANVPLFLRPSLSDKPKCPR